MTLTSSQQEENEVSKLVRTLRWKDTFFNEEEGLIAVFDYDYEKIASFDEQVTLLTLLFPPVLVFGTLFACMPCMYKQQVEWDVYSKHVAITRDGIKVVQDKHKTMCGYPCSDTGKFSKTVPFDKITDCDVQEPAGATCFCVENVLSDVNVDTASGRDLSLSGLKEPHQFKQLVWAMKRANARGTAPTASAVPLQPSMEGTASGIELSAPTSFSAPFQSTMDRAFSNEETSAILRDIRNELIELNANIKSMNK